MNQLKISFWMDSHYLLYTDLSRNLVKNLERDLAISINRKMRIDYGNFKPL